MDSNEGVGTVARKSSIILFVKFALTFFSWLGFLFVARYMGTEAVGLIGFSLGLVGIFLQSDFGFGLAHNKMISEGKDLGECIGAYIVIKTILLTSAIGLMLGLVFIWEKVLGLGYQDPIQQKMILIMLFYFVLFSLAQIPIQTFGGLRQSAKQQMPEFIGTFARVPVMIYVSLAGLGVIALAYSYVLTGAVMVFLAFLMLRKFSVKKPSKKLLRSYSGFAAPVAIYMVFSTISLNIDKVAIQLFWDSTEVGYFFGMQRVIVVMTMLAISLLPILLPSISRYNAKGLKKEIKKLLFKAERYISMLLIPMMVLFSILSSQVIHIMVGDEFLPAADVLVLLSFFALFYSLNIPHIQTLYGCGHPKKGARVGITIALTNTILLFILVPRDIMGFELMGMGAKGAALASLISVIAGFFLSRHYTRICTRIRYKQVIHKHWAAGLFMALMLYLIIQFMVPERWYELLAFGLIGLLSYLGGLVALKEFGKRDIDFFLDILNLKKLKEYLKLEFS